MALRLRGLLAVLFALALADASSALTIDNFDEGVIAVVDDSTTPGATFGVNTGLDPSNTVGGNRLVSVVASEIPLVGVPGTATATSVPGPAGFGSFTSTVQGQFSIFYDGNGDLTPDTNGGQLFLDLTNQDAFSVDLLNVNATDAEFRVTLWDGDSLSNSLFQPATTGVHIIPFSSFSGIDFDDIRAIRLNIAEVLTLASVSVNDFSAIPEPGTALLLGLGLAGLAARARSRR